MPHEAPASFDGDDGLRSHVVVQEDLCTACPSWARHLVGDVSATAGLWVPGPSPVPSPGCSSPSCCGHHLPPCGPGSHSSLTPGGAAAAGPSLPPPPAFFSLESTGCRHARLAAVAPPACLWRLAPVLRLMARRPPWLSPSLGSRPRGCCWLSADRSVPSPPRWTAS